jgi:hypothetical protein
MNRKLEQNWQENQVLFVVEMGCEKEFCFALFSL